jgi:transposase
MEEDKGKETKGRRKFEREFKNDAVRLVELSNRSVKQVAKELDISEATLSNWVYESRKAKRGASGAGPDLVDENRQLRKENERLRMEKEILKRFSAFWVKETGES